MVIKYGQIFIISVVVLFSAYHYYVINKLLQVTKGDLTSILYNNKLDRPWKPEKNLWLQ